MIDQGYYRKNRSTSWQTWVSPEQLVVCRYSGQLVQVSHVERHHQEGSARGDNAIVRGHELKTKEW